jgi:hypothetical protein
MLIHTGEGKRSIDDDHYASTDIVVRLNAVL